MMMETQAQQPEAGNSPLSQDILSLSDGENSNLSKLPGAKESESQWQQIMRQVVDLFDKLPDYLGRFFKDNKQNLIILVLILSALVTVKVAIALLDAVNDLPLLKPIFEAIGLFYSIWFTVRYLIKFETRQELSQKFDSFKQESLG
jgi:hypothetical protein